MAQPFAARLERPLHDAIAGIGGPSDGPDDAEPHEDVVPDREAAARVDLEAEPVDQRCADHDGQGPEQGRTPATVRNLVLDQREVAADLVLQAVAEAALALRLAPAAQPERA